MSNWATIERDVPELASRVRRRFEMGVNKTIATLRSDGAPRISATELEFADGEVTFGMMGGSVKVRDVRRDPRIAIHCPTIEVPEAETMSPHWPGDVKLAGLAVEVNAPDDNTYVGAGFFRVDITELALTYVGEPRDHLVIESWHAGIGLRRRTAR
jgi:Pyridoxamine 5'-phosphate oxidase